MRRRGLRLEIRQRGYMLITLMLALALITIGLLTVLPEIGQQIRRDREEEMMHRGTAYMRAIQHFYKKFGRYPMRIEELENTNNLRFIRKRYKDPINRDPATGRERDFKLLHPTDISLNNGPVLGQGSGQSLPPGQGGLQGGLQSQGGFGGAQRGLGGLSGGLGGLGAQPGGVQQTSNPGAQTSASSDAGNSSSDNSSDTGGNSNSAGSSSSNSNTNSGSGFNGSGFNGPTFGGGPIVGVASTSKEKSIRVFYEKDHYKDWLFIYVPQGDRGGLLTGPVNPGMPTGNLGGPIPGQPGVGPAGQGLGQGTTGQPPSLPTQPAQNPGQTGPEE